MEKYICVHGHFYQPPRENPWLEAIERQVSAHPYHNWNQRVSAECYQPNGVARILDKSGRIEKIINNYARISFNFGPTLLSWLEAEEPIVYERILEADKESRERFSGHGSAMAQGYNHAILPLCNKRDKITQVLWGIRDFIHRFGRMPEGMWLPETAVGLETLDIMARAGIKFAVLAPHQAARIRKRGESAWRDAAGCPLDAAYEISLPEGRKMALFFYNGAISNAVGFEKLLSDGSHFLDRLMGAFSPKCDRAQLAHIAVDGETFGHHHRFGEMALAWVLNKIESEGNVRLTNYGEFLEKHPPTHCVEIRERSSWSCCHGIGRWREDCGCNTGEHPDWRQLWRKPLRKALDALRNRLIDIYSSVADGLLRDPWAARNDYVDLILDRSADSVDRFFEKHSARALNSEERVRSLKLLEMQRHALLMYTSCGWFFDDIAGIETLQILQYAGRAIQLAEELSGQRSVVSDLQDMGAQASSMNSKKINADGTPALPCQNEVTDENDIESSFLDILRKAKSNSPEKGDGRDLYLRFVKPAIIDETGIAAHYAMRALFQDFHERTDFYSCTVERKHWQTMTRGRAKLVLCRAQVTSRITSETAAMNLAAVHDGAGHIQSGIRKKELDPQTEEEIRAEFEKEDWTSVFSLLNKYFSDAKLSLNEIIPDERRKILDVLIQSANADFDRRNQEEFERIEPLLNTLTELGVEPSARFVPVAAEWIQERLPEEYRLLRMDHVETMLKSAKSWNIQLNGDMLEPILRETLEKFALELRNHPEDMATLRNFSAAASILPILPFSVNLYGTQNYCYDSLRKHYPRKRIAAEKGDVEAGIWVAEFRKLLKLLSIETGE